MRFHRKHVYFSVLKLGGILRERFPEKFSLLAMAACHLKQPVDLLENVLPSLLHNLSLISYVIDCYNFSDINLTTALNSFPGQ